MSFEWFFLRLFFDSLVFMWPFLVGLCATIAILGGIVGRLEGWAGANSLYYAFITATTVGYGDLHPTKTPSKFIAIAIALTGMMLTGVVVALALNAATYAFQATHDIEAVKERYMNRVNPGTGTPAEPEPASTSVIEVPLVGTSQIARHSDSLEWAACPSGPLPDGCAMAVLEGDPAAETLFTVRFRTTEPSVLPPHTHPKHVRVTILEGALSVGFGDEGDEAASVQFTEGDHYVTGAGVQHFVWATEPVVIQRG